MKQLYGGGRVLLEAEYHTLWVSPLLFLNKDNKQE